MASIGEDVSENKAHTDRFSTAFTDPNLDPVQFLNNVVPRLSLSKTTPTTGSATLNEVSSSTQSLLSHLGAHNSQLSATLTQLTDEILRSGSRLAYEVEILRGDTIGLSDALTETLQHEVALFGPAPTSKTNGELDEQDDIPDETGMTEGIHSNEPEYVTKLRMFNQVRLRLEEVIAAFGEAMEWPIAPSEVSVGSSFISVSAPEKGQDSQSQEAKGREVAEKLREDLKTLLSGGIQDTRGFAAAVRRIEHLRTLASIWKGTAEEKARMKFIDSLSQMVEEQRGAIGSSQGNIGGSVRLPERNSNSRAASNSESASSNKGGLFRNLQRLRDEIYLE